MVGGFKSTQPWLLLKMTQRCTPKILAQPRSIETQLGSLNPCNLGWGTLRREALSFLSGSDVDRQFLYGFDEDRETSTDGRQAHSKSPQRSLPWGGHRVQAKIQSPTSPYPQTTRGAS